MANFTEDQTAAVAEVTNALFEYPIFDPVPVQKMLYHFCRGYNAARSGEAGDSEMANANKYCAVFCKCYCAGYTAGTT